MNSTNANIRYEAFKQFLEKGYEATNIRDICKAVDIKPSSLYFYYKSKQELFFSIYDEIWEKELEHIKNIDEFKKNIPAELELYILFKNTITYQLQDIAKQKFLLRYHLFPSNEISQLILERFRYWTKEKDKITLNIINKCINEGILDSRKGEDYFLDRYKRFADAQLIEMIISNIKKNDEEINISWLSFWNGEMISGPFK